MDPLCVDPDNQYPSISYHVSPRESDSDNDSIDNLILHPSTPVPPSTATATRSTATRSLPTRHYGHSRTHSGASGTSSRGNIQQTGRAKLTDTQQQHKDLLQVALLEAGILFHSVFIGMALSVATGANFIVLLIAISFHRMLPLLPAHSFSMAV